MSLLRASSHAARARPLSARVSFVGLVGTRGCVSNRKSQHVLSHQLPLLLHAAGAAAHEGIPRFAPSPSHVKRAAFAGWPAPSPRHVKGLTTRRRAEQAIVPPLPSLSAEAGARAKGHLFKLLYLLYFSSLRLAAPRNYCSTRLCSPSLCVLGNSLFSLPALRSPPWAAE